jgi:hypothetical protein
LKNVARLKRLGVAALAAPLVLLTAGPARADNDHLMLRNWTGGTQMVLDTTLQAFDAMLTGPGSTMSVVYTVPVGEVGFNYCLGFRDDKRPLLEVPIRLINRADPSKSAVPDGLEDLYIDVSTDGGTTFHSFADFPDNDPMMGYFKSFDMGAYRGKRVEVKFTYKAGLGPHSFSAPNNFEVLPPFSTQDSGGTGDRRPTPS